MRFKIETSKINIIMKIKNKNAKVLMMSGNKYEKTILKNILSQLIEYELFSCIAYISKIIAILCMTSFQ